MARDNRKENRQKAKAENENAAPDGTDLSEFLDNSDENEEEELSDGLDEAKEKDEKTEDEKDETKKNADKSEEDEKKKAGKEASLDDLSDAKSVDNDDDDEEVKKADGTDDKAKAEADAKAKVGETAEEKATREAKEEADRIEAEAKKTEPAPKEKTEAEKKDEKTESETLTDEQAAELFTNWRGETQKLLAEHVYRLTDEDVAELNENPAAYIPKVAARVYLDCISASFQQFVTYLPRMVHQVLEAREGINKQENDFYAAWPQLAAHKDKVLRMGASYRKENPSASMEDFINEVGAQAMVALRLSPEKANGKAAEEESAAKGKKSFKPAIDGSASSTPPQQKSQNPFDQMSQEWGLQGEELDDS